MNEAWINQSLYCLQVVPLTSWTQLPRHLAPSSVCVWGYRQHKHLSTWWKLKCPLFRWLIFRIMLGAGLIKVKLVNLQCLI